MECTGKLKGIARDWNTNQCSITLSINENFAISEIDKLKDDKLSIKITKYRKKRSLDANAYAWVLIDKLASKLNIKKEEVYRNAIREIGGVSEMLCIKNEAVEKFCTNWQKNGIGWQTETFPSKFKNCTNVIIYYGSSTFDSKQMSMLIDLIIQECRQHEIETLPPAELERLMEQYEKHIAKQ
jgi:hypothetical protein